MPRILELAEFKPLALAPEALSAEFAATIRVRYSDQIQAGRDGRGMWVRGIETGL